MYVIQWVSINFFVCVLRCFAHFSKKFKTCALKRNDRRALKGPKELVFGLFVARLTCILLTVCTRFNFTLILVHHTDWFPIFDRRNQILPLSMAKNKIDLYMSVFCRLQTYAPRGPA